MVKNIYLFIFYPPPNPRLAVSSPFVLIPAETGMHHMRSESNKLHVQGEAMAVRWRQCAASFVSFILLLGFPTLPHPPLFLRLPIFRTRLVASLPRDPCSSVSLLLDVVSASAWTLKSAPLQHLSSNSGHFISTG